MLHINNFVHEVTWKKDKSYYLSAWLIHWRLKHGEGYLLKVTILKRYFPLSFFPIRPFLLYYGNPVFFFFILHWLSFDHGKTLTTQIWKIRLQYSTSNSEWVWIAATSCPCGNYCYRINVVSWFPPEISITWMSLYHINKRQILEIQIILSTLKNPVLRLDYPKICTLSRSMSYICTFCVYQAKSWVYFKQILH